MKIALDITTAGLIDGDRGGVYRYIVKLIDNLKKIDKENQYILFFNFMNPRHRENCNAFFSDYQKNKFQKVVCLFPPPLRMKLRLPIEWFVGSVDIFHSPAHWASPTKKVNSIVTIHDMAYLKRDKLESNWKQSLQSFVGQRSKAVKLLKKRRNFFNCIEKYTQDTVEHCDRIITVSHATKNDLLNVFPNAEKKVRVIYEGVSRGFRPITDTHLIEDLKQKYGIKSAYILYLGNLDPNKNLQRLLGAFSAVKKEGKIPHQLVIVGHRSWYHKILVEMVDKLKAEGDVIFTGYVPDTELPIFYSGAEVFILPSHMEGFGLPVLEAMACGTPVIVANGGSLPEIVGDAGLLVDPMDEGAMAEALHNMICLPDLRQDLIKRGFKQIKHFSWEKMARETLSLYQEVFAETRN